MVNDRNLGDVCLQLSSSQSTAIIDLTDDAAPKHVSYSALYRESGAYARLLDKENIAKGAIVAIVGLNSGAYLAAYFGVLRSGRVALPINVKQPKSAIQFMFDDAGAQFSFLSDECAALAPSDTPCAKLDQLLTLSDRYDGNYVSAAPGEDEAAEILYTSGSMGRPKGVVLSHKSQLTMIDAMGRATAQSPLANRTSIVAAPLFHMNALIFSTSILAAGGCVVLAPTFDVDRFIDAIMRYDVQLITGVPTMIAMMAHRLGASSEAFPKVETVYIGSSPLTQPTVEQARRLFPNAVVLNSYGTTETGGGLFGAHPSGIDRPETSVGCPLDHAEIRLRNKNEENAGVLEVRSPTNMTRYHNMPELTAEKMQSGWINTGDIFRHDENGFYFYVGRVDDMFVCNGENIFPGELESLIEKHEGVDQACIIPMDNEKSGAVPVAFIVSGQPEPTEAAIKDFVLRRAPAYMYPRRVFFVESFPLSTTNKVDKKQLREIAKRAV